MLHEWLQDAGGSDPAAKRRRTQPDRTAQSEQKQLHWRLQQFFILQRQSTTEVHSTMKIKACVAVGRTSYQQRTCGFETCFMSRLASFADLMFGDFFDRNEKPWAPQKFEHVTKGPAGQCPSKILVLGASPRSSFQLTDTLPGSTQREDRQQTSQSPS